MEIKIVKDDRKNVVIKVLNADEIIIFAPKEITKDKIQDIVQLKKDWIEQRVQYHNKINTTFNDVFKFKRAILDGYQLNVVSNNDKKLYIFENNVSIPMNKYDDLTQRREEIIKVVKKYAREKLPQLISYYAEQMKLCPSAIEIKRIRGGYIWGKCYLSKKIVIDFRVICLPECLQKYIIIHELTHLLQLNHSSNFWNLVKLRIPDYKHLKKDLYTYTFVKEIY